MRAVFFLTLAAAGMAQTPGAPGQNQTRRDLIVEGAEGAERLRKPGGPVAIPRSYALVIGVGEYANLTREQQLQFSERDAEQMYSILISPEGGNFKAQNVHRLIGRQATLENLRREIEEWLPSVAQDEDRVLIYFAGHGFVAGGQAYLAPFDVNPRSVQSTGYPMARLGEMFARRIKGKWKVLLADACHSGAISPEAVQQVNASLMDLSRSVFVLTASRDREVSFESPEIGGGRGLFTYYVERGMGGAADENRDGIVTADELGNYVRTNVRRDSGGRQNPSEGGSFDREMLLAYSAAGVAPDAPPPARFGVMVIESNMDGVEVFVDGKSVGVVNKGTPLRLQGMAPGPHQVQGVKTGWDPDGPREEVVYPGQELTVSIRMRTMRRRNKAAVEELNRGIENYRNGGAANYRKAAEHFARALALDGAYGEAALYLGRTYNALYEQEKAEQYFRKAIEIDPDSTEARASFGGMLLDKGNDDEAIRQLNAVVVKDKRNALAYTQLAAALRNKEAWDQAIEAARRAIALAPGTAEPYFWLADSLRLKKPGDYVRAKEAYNEYLRLSNFDSKLAGQLNYWVRGFLIGGGRKSRASQRDIWKDMRSLAHFGICDCERLLKRIDEALAQCQKALSYDPQDPYIHYLLGRLYAARAEETSSLESAATAAKYFRSTLQLNPEIEYAQGTRQMLANIDRALRGN